MIDRNSKAYRFFYNSTRTMLSGVDSVTEVIGGVAVDSASVVASAAVGTFEAVRDKLADAPQPSMGAKLADQAADHMMIQA